tara:strand:+ start:420 stop:674 length:255 start_codon:yes stop_codon:yes gene_type:complete
MANDRVLGWILCLGSLAGLVVYFWLLFMSPHSMMTLRVSNFIMVGMFHLIIAWIGYTLATTPPPIPLEDFDFETEAEEEGEASE